MPTLAFLPWFAVEDDLEVYQFRLLRYERDGKPYGSGSAEQQAADMVLANYWTERERIVDDATLLEFDAESPMFDLKAEQVESAFNIVQLVSFVGISQRKYFSGLDPYVNHDHFDFVIQRFQDSSSGVAVKTRRRDGSRTTHQIGGAFRRDRPEQVADSVVSLRLDERLLNAIVAARDTDLGPRLLESIINFNLANTDRNTMAEHVEAVFLISAFERVLGCGGKEHELARAFVGSFKPSKQISPSCRTRFQDPEVPTGLFNRDSIREMWIRDFYRARGNLAHGRIEVKCSAVWTLEDHLLLGAYAFPLLVKQLLADRGLYVLNSDDRIEIDVFEELASYEHFVPFDGPPNKRSYPWVEVMTSAYRDKFFGGD